MDPFKCILALIIIFCMGGNSQTTNTTPSPANATAAPSTPSPTNATPTPATDAPTVAPIPTDASGNVNITTLPDCPFSRWQGKPRYCYECRWCPFRAETCCEMEDEIDVLKSVNVSGSDDWDCFITIVHFQQCGRCSPSAKSYVMNKLMDYVWDPRNLSIRPCKQACRYIHKQCKGASLLNGKAIVPEDMSVEQFCADAPEYSTPELPCYNGSWRAAVAWSAVFIAVMVALLLF